MDCFFFIVGVQPVSMHWFYYSDYKRISYSLARNSHIDGFRVDPWQKFWESNMKLISWQRLILFPEFFLVGNLVDSTSPYFVAITQNRFDKFIKEAEIQFGIYVRAAFILNIAFQPQEHRFSVDLVGFLLSYISSPRHLYIRQQYANCLVWLTCFYSWMHAQLWVSWC